MGISWGFGSGAGFCVEAGDTVGMFVVGGFEEFGSALGADDGCAAEDFWGLAGGGESAGDFCLDGIDEEASADRGSGGDWGIEVGDVDHGISRGCAGIESEAGEVLEFFTLGVFGGAGFRVLFTDDGDDLDAAFLEACGYFDGDEVTAAGGDDEGGVGGADGEVAEDTFGEAGDIFEEHGLALAVGADDKVMEAEGEFDDGVEAGEGAIAGPHFFDHDTAMA
ncbi:MAG: hypothetical protein RI897_4181 [Verrucomicrobiota bacterium]